MGFAHSRHRRDSQTTLYEIGVASKNRKQGLGRAMVHTVVEEARVQGKVLLRLKCPIDLPANAFYQHLGFTLLGQERGKRRMLNVWGMSICQ
jgi:GNAT superfamily N-acetyltransferase